MLKEFLCAHLEAANSLTKKKMSLRSINVSLKYQNDFLDGIWFVSGAFLCADPSRSEV